MQNTDITAIDNIIQSQREYFKSGATLNIKFRLNMLNKLSEAIEKMEDELYSALYTDLHKSKEEAYLTEISIIKGELKKHLKHLKKWAKPTKVKTPISLFPSKSYIQYEPLGNTLIVAPWNYPVQLVLNPLVGAISSGCTALLKPSPYTPNVSLCLQKLIESTFDSNYIAVVQGDRHVNSHLLEQRFDLIFLTGSPNLGKIAMEKAAKYLTPLILELGGKSPCIIEKEADIQVAARRLAWGKTMNSGQTCIAPDYLFINKDIKDKFISVFTEELKNLHGENIIDSPHYARIVNDNSFERLISYLNNGKILYGGRYEKDQRFIEPTVIEVDNLDCPVMQEEIFGPILPLIQFDNIDNVVNYIQKHEKPLAFYYFGDEKKGWSIINKTTSGGACINDTLVHIANEHLPFGGVGNSGMGKYHGYESFISFSNRRAVIVSPKKFDLPLRYMPYKFFSIIKKIV